MLLKIFFVDNYIQGKSSIHATLGARGIAGHGCVVQRQNRAIIVSVTRGMASSPSFTDLYGVRIRAKGSFDFVNRDGVVVMGFIMDLQ